MGPRGARLEMAGFGFTIPLASQEMVRELLRDDEPFTVRDRVGTHDPIAQIVAETLISRGILRYHRHRGGHTKKIDKDREQAESLSRDLRYTGLSAAGIIRTGHHLK